MKTALLLCTVLCVAGCANTPYMQQKQAHCLDLIETVEGVPEYVELSREVLDVYDECVEDYGGTA